MRISSSCFTKPGIEPYILLMEGIAKATAQFHTFCPTPRWLTNMAVELRNLVSASL